MAKKKSRAAEIEPAFEGARDEADWNQHSQIIVLRNFIEHEAELDPLVAERFQKYLDDRIEEENQESLDGQEDEE